MTKFNSTSPNPSNDNILAVNLIRQKLQQVYLQEPDAKEELLETNNTPSSLSPHQQFMYNLGRSGKSLAEIQTAWHNYYVELPDNQKHQVWQEFYEEHNRRSRTALATPIKPVAPAQPIQTFTGMPALKFDRRTVTDIKRQLLKHVSKRPNQKKGGHLQSLLFGLSSGFVVLAILLFGFFNERFIAPFISPSKTVSATAIIIDPNSTTSVGPEPKIIIPKINVEIPVVYTEPSVEENAVQKALEQGVLHYATTSNPGELGNGAIFGHSSNNILNKGDYKFAFVLLKRLETGDTFIIQKDGKRYVYRVFAKKIVKPEDVSVLGDTQGKSATFSLITCDPPGTSLNRLVVTGEQITPDPNANLASTAKPVESQPKILPSNSPSLWQKITNWFSS
ncbi:MAG: sortase [Patescibacteria group bacterium]